MTDKLISICDHVLTETFEAVGLARFSRGVYAQSNDDVIWRGVWVTFNIRKGTLITQPSVGVFCPAAEKLVSDGLSELHGGNDGRPYFGKLGGPVLTRLLYNLVRNVINEDRMPFSYDVTNINQVNEMTSLMRDDFIRAGRRFLDPIDSLSKLRDQLVADNAAGAGMYAIAVTYLMNKQITSDEIGELLGPQPNAMLREFAEYFRMKFAGTSA